MTHNIKYITSWALALLTLSSCNDWLNVQPHSQIDDTELFSNESGFKEALAGVYSSMVNSQTYSKEATYGFMAILGQEWDYYPSAQYQDAAQYDYKAAMPTTAIRNIWTNNYNGIANVNNLLAHVDDKTSIFGKDNHHVIKGEALALRAFLHFDLLRCFGVGYAVNRDMPSIPYSTALDYHVFPQLKVHEVAEAVMTDLKAAEDLLSTADPIVTERTITESTDNGYLLNRTLHLNYYAVKGLEARVYMWMQEYDKALNAAKEVINAQKFNWSTVANMQAGYDRSLADEHLFALNNLTVVTDVAETYFDEGSANAFAVTRERLLDYFDNATQDYRYTFIFKTGSGQHGNNRYLAKYDAPSSSSNNFYMYKMPLMRLGEMYLIAAEAEYYNNHPNEALAYLNTLRTKRNLTPLQEMPTDFLLEMVHEYRRELIGEGQLFFLYKRLNRSNILYSDVDAVADKVYTFPLPVNETEGAYREPNK